MTCAGSSDDASQSGVNWPVWLGDYREINLFRDETRAFRFELKLSSIKKRDWKKNSSFFVECFHRRFENDRAFKKT